MYSKHIRKALIVSLIIAILCSMPYLFACKHKEVKNEVVIPATCTEVGCGNVICVNCGETVDNFEIPIITHSYGEYKIIEKPSSNKNGKEAKICNGCGDVSIREVVCPHDDTTIEILTIPTCTNEGLNEVSCNICGTVFENLTPVEHGETKSQVLVNPSCRAVGRERQICLDCKEVVGEHEVPMIECSYGEWNFSSYATPFEAGEKYRFCTICGNKDIEEYSIEMTENSMYIPSVNILCDFAVTRFTQSAVNNNDVIYTNHAYSGEDTSNPFILGHWFGSLIDLHNTKIGEYVYVCVDNRIDTYEILASEYAWEKDGCHMIGQTTGVNVWDSYGSEVNFSKACYGRSHDGIDRLEDEDDGRTLHIYTCHYGKDKDEWNPKHGSNGRWLTLCNLIDSQNLG